MKKKMHEPIRECISCGEKFPKRELVRVVQNDTGIYVDTDGHAPGRGAYVCKNSDCLSKLVKQRRLNRAFKKQVSNEVYDAVTCKISEV